MLFRFQSTCSSMLRFQWTQHGRRKKNSTLFNLQSTKWLSRHISQWSFVRHRAKRAEAHRDWVDSIELAPCIKNLIIISLFLSISLHQVIEFYGKFLLAHFAIIFNHSNYLTIFILYILVGNYGSRCVCVGSYVIKLFNGILMWMCSHKYS